MNKPNLFLTYKKYFLLALFIYTLFWLFNETQKYELKLNNGDKLSIKESDVKYTREYSRWVPITMRFLGSDVP